MRIAWIATLAVLIAGCGRNVEMQVRGAGGAEPDRVLYEQAIKDLGRSRYTVARLTLQTLIQTYPDSEFLPEAKYALAESFYREGTTSNYNQAEAEFKDYITFFPTSERADDAQLMIAMTHMRQLEKPDRDASQAVLAETELTKMIEGYPDSPLLDEAKEKLRAVQEILAEGNFKVGNHYLLRKAFTAAVSRYREVLDRYPDYSRMPEVLFNLAEALREADNPESAIYYGKIVSEYPFSEQVEESKRQLVALNRPIPEVSPAALARGEQDRQEKGMFGKFFGTFGRRPDVSTETNASSVRPKDDQPEEDKSGTADDPKAKPDKAVKKPKR